MLRGQQNYSSTRLICKKGARFKPKAPAHSRILSYITFSRFASNETSDPGYCLLRYDRTAFRCTNGDFYVALGFSMGSALLVWVGGGLLKRDLYFFGNEPSLGQNSPILHLPPEQLSGRVLAQRIVRSAVHSNLCHSIPLWR